MSTREEMNSLAQEIMGAYEARLEDVAQMRKATHEQLGESHAAHNAMAQQQREDLSKGRSDLATSVVNQLKELDAAHQAMARQQREGLVKVHADLNRAETRRKAGFHSWMKEVTAAHTAAREEWQNLAATMQAKRGGAVAVAEAPAPAFAGKAAPAAPAREVAEQKTSEEELGNEGLVDQVFAYLADRPDGTRLTELEDAFGASRFETARIIRRLTDEGKVEKREMLYFAV